MKKSFILIFSLILLVSVVFVLIYAFLIRPVSVERTIERTMYGAEIDSEGNIIREFSFTVIEKEEQDRSGALSIHAEIEFPDTDAPPLRYTQVEGKWHSDFGTAFCYMSGLGYSQTENRYISVIFGLDTDKESCILIAADTDTVVIGSSDPKYDVAAILQTYESMIP